MKMRRLLKLCLVIVFGFALSGLAPSTLFAAEESGSIGVEGRISSPPPTEGATISLPANNASFTTLPITVQGLCPDELLVKLFKNNVFAGSVQCNNGSYSLITDLFSGQNELVARVYDELDQAGPDSNIVNVTYSDPNQGVSSQVTLTSNFAKRGTNPGQTLSWPIILSGGSGPYAISVDWGDGSEEQLISREFPGTFNIDHVYDSPGIYNIVVKVVDGNGGTAFLQLVGIGNGPLSQESGGAEGGDSGAGDAEASTTILWQPAAILIPFIATTFWLGKKYEIKSIKQRIARGERPF